VIEFLAGVIVGALGVFAALWYDITAEKLEDWLKK
jgi:hypothetical protein